MCFGSHSFSLSLCLFPTRKRYCSGSSLPPFSNSLGLCESRYCDITLGRSKKHPFPWKESHRAYKIKAGGTVINIVTITMWVIFPYSQPKTYQFQISPCSLTIYYPIHPPSLKNLALCSLLRGKVFYMLCSNLMTRKNVMWWWHGVVQ